jgi:acetate kinase
MDMTVLSINAGSNSLQLTVLDEAGRELYARRLPTARDPQATRAALVDVLRESPPIHAVGHRVVHGGSHVLAHVRLDAAVRAHLDTAQSLAPLHLPNALNVMDTALELVEDLPHVVCLDTAFHAQLPDATRTYALPESWRQRYDLHRYGFHGLSYAWALHRSAALLGKPSGTLQLLMAHLGGGASVCGVREGQSIDTSMGFTPMEGLVMGTRAGSVDPGLVLWLLTAQGMPVDQLADGLNRGSGLLGLSGRSSDTRDLVSWAAQGDTKARMALDVFCQRAAEELAAAATSLTRLDAVVFTGEIGGDQPEVRTAICQRLSLLGVRGEGLAPVIDVDAVISPPSAQVPVLVIRTGEAQQIAKETRQVLQHA